MLTKGAVFGLHGLILATMISPATADQYKYTKIKIPGSVETNALYVNESHKVTGTYTLKNGKLRLFTYDAGVIKTFRAPDPYQNEAIRPTAIGPTGLVVGVYGDTAIFPFMLRADASEVEKLPYPEDGQNGVTPTSIGPGDAELVGGYLNSFEGAVVGFITSPTTTGSWGEYGFGGAKSVTITALATIKNSFEGYVGNYVADEGQHGFQGLSSNAIDPPGSANTWITYLNNNADLGGYAVNRAGKTFGFVRREDGFTTYRYPNAPHTTVTRNLHRRVFGEFRKRGKAHAFVLTKGKYYEVQRQYDEVTLTGVARDGSFAGSFLAKDGHYRGYLATCESGSGECEVGGPGVKATDAETSVAAR